MSVPSCSHPIWPAGGDVGLPCLFPGTYGVTPGCFLCVCDFSALLKHLNKSRSVSVANRLQVIFFQSVHKLLQPHRLPHPHVFSCTSWKKKEWLSVKWRPQEWRWNPQSSRENRKGSNSGVLFPLWASKGCRREKVSWSQWGGERSSTRWNTACVKLCRPGHRQEQGDAAWGLCFGPLSECHQYCVKSSAVRSEVTLQKAPVASW